MASSRADNRGASAGFYSAARAVPARFIAAVLLLTSLVAPSCQTVPVTGRSQLNMFSVEQDKELGAQAYKEVISQSKLADSGPEADLVRRVVARLAAVADDPGFDWEAHVIDDPETVNAWCMPGGKIAVYTGILPVTQDETGLAVVLGHEIAHAIARHGTERMSTQGLTQEGLSILAGSVDSVAQYQQVIGAAANVFVFMPWGRSQELEADQIGLIYMARAGYDPRKAIDFWQRMEQAAGGGSPPEFLSTHPSGQKRIQQLKELMPKALAEYEARGSGPAQL
jgi:metalloendopeptidase OMA1, mitochondrial